VITEASMVNQFTPAGRGRSPVRPAVRDAGAVSADQTQPRAVHARTTRQQRIVDHVLANGSASAAELVELTGVSLMTVHRGGVSAQPTSVFEAHSEYRRAVRLGEKNAIAEAALAMVEPGSSIMVDDSSTALMLVERLHTVSPLTVVTNYLPAIALLKDMAEVRLIALGGDYSRTHDSFGGIGCVEAVAAMSVDVTFVSTSSMTGSMTYHQEQEIVMVKRAMLDAAARRVLLMDSGKAPRRALHQLRPLSAFDELVIDTGVSDDLLLEMREHARVTVAKSAN
jgi:DeoR/GlpR family transcriptional regulator of sugar metabolism